jgi:hypothetical protein
VRGVVRVSGVSGGVYPRFFFFWIFFLGVWVSGVSGECGERENG